MSDFHWNLKFIPRNLSLATVAQLLLKLKVDSLLNILAGLMSLLTSLMSHRNRNARRFRSLVIGPDDYDVISWACLILLIVGVVSLALGLLKSLKKVQMSFNQYVCMTVSLLVVNFCSGVILTEYKGHITFGLEDAMRNQLRESVAAKKRFGVGFDLSESWDDIQIRLMCCGVDSYKDYMDLGGVSSLRTQILPTSCCALKTADRRAYLAGDDSSLLEPDNLSQCQLDARQYVVQSIYLYTQGCHGPVSRWLTRYLNKMIAMVFATICLQALCVLYLSWIGFRNSPAYSSQKT